VKQANEFVRKLQHLDVFRKVKVQEIDADKISKFIESCQSFDEACGQMPGPFQLAEQYINRNTIGLDPRIQLAQRAGKPWLQTLSDAKTALKQLSQENKEKQEKTQRLIVKRSRLCRQMQQEAKERQQKEIAPMLVEALNYVVALERTFIECSYQMEKKHPYESWCALSNEERAKAVVECDKQYTYAHKLFMEASQKIDGNIQNCLQKYKGPRSTFTEYQAHFTRLQDRIRARKMPLREMALQLRNMKEAVEEKVAFTIAEQIQAMMKEKELGDEGFFNSISKEGVLKFEDFKEHFKVSEVLQKYAKNIFDVKVRPGQKGIEFPAFNLMKKVLYGVEMETPNPITESLEPDDMGSSKRVLETDEVVEALEPRKLIGSSYTSLWRIKVKCTIDNLEGYVNVRGMTKDSLPLKYLVPFTQRLSIVCDHCTFTEKFELDNFKEVRRRSLEKGEELWALDIPKKEDTLKVNRIKCLILDAPAKKKVKASAEKKDDAAATEKKNDEGFITLKGTKGETLAFHNYMATRKDDQFMESTALEGPSKVHIPGENGEVEITDKVEKLFPGDCSVLEISIAAFNETASELKKYVVPDAEATTEDLYRIYEEFEAKASKKDEINIEVRKTYDLFANELKEFTAGVLGDIKANIDKIYKDHVEFKTGTMDFVRKFREKMSQAIGARRLKGDQIPKEKANEERRKLSEDKKSKAAEINYGGGPHQDIMIIINDEVAQPAVDLISDSDSDEQMNQPANEVVGLVASIDPSNEVTTPNEPIHKGRESNEPTHEATKSIVTSNQATKWTEPVNEVVASIESTNKEMTTNDPSNEAMESTEPAHEATKCMETSNQIMAAETNAEQVHRYLRRSTRGGEGEEEEEEEEEEEREEKMVEFNDKKTIAPMDLLDDQELKPKSPEEEAPERPKCGLYPLERVKEKGSSWFRCQSCYVVGRYCINGYRACGRKKCKEYLSGFTTKGQNDRIGLLAAKKAQGKPLNGNNELLKPKAGGSKEIDELDEEANSIKYSGGSRKTIDLSDLEDSDEETNKDPSPDSRARGVSVVKYMKRVKTKRAPRIEVNYEYSCSVKKCNLRIVSSIKERDSLGPAGPRCRTHAPRCVVDKCGNAGFRKCGIDKKNQKTGWYCKMHGYKLRKFTCGVKSCKKKSITRITNYDKFGGPGERCTNHFVCRTPNCKNKVRTNNKKGKKYCVKHRKIVGV